MHLTGRPDEGLLVPGEEVDNNPDSGGCHGVNRTEYS